ncbi:MAG: hypothetical protein HQL92_08025, partial [Magnetococcales bacterium]|nr:hypothetical protein [Magnetococcales bacterium]
SLNPSLSRTEPEPEPEPDPDPEPLVLALGPAPGSTEVVEETSAVVAAAPAPMDSAVAPLVQGAMEAGGVSSAIREQVEGVVRSWIRAVLADRLPVLLEEVIREELERIKGGR